jgi:hypothetical protein
MGTKVLEEPAVSSAVKMETADFPEAILRVSQICTALHLSKLNFGIF